MQEGSDPEHTSRSTSKWLTKTKMKVLGWLSQSLDLNLIEMLDMTSNIPFMLENPPVKQYFIFWRERVLFPHIKYYMKDKSRASQQQRGLKKNKWFFFSLFWPRSVCFFCFFYFFHMNIFVCGKAVWSKLCFDGTRIKEDCVTSVDVSDVPFLKYLKQSHIHRLCIQSSSHSPNFWKQK